MKQRKGFAIALAWPEMYCKQTAAWYDEFTHVLGISRYRFYKVGHAAVTLVDPEGNCHYYDFGRYHAPYSYGRVRGAVSDHDLIVRTKAVFSEDGKQILNFREILEELQRNPACHGEGKLHASYALIDYDAAHKKVSEMHTRHILPYGPFIWNGTNCARFVNTIIRAGKIKWNKWFYLRFLKPITSTTLTNVHGLNKKLVLPHMQEKAIFIPTALPEKARLYGILPAPPIPDSLKDKNIHWLSGEGAGSWFLPEFKEKTVFLQRFTADGALEGEAELNHITGALISENEPYRVVYPSALHKLSLEQNGEIIVFAC
jgi:hypothetical protein